MSAFVWWIEVLFLFWVVLMVLVVISFFWDNDDA